MSHLIIDVVLSRGAHFFLVLHQEAVLHKVLSQLKVVIDETVLYMPRVNANLHCLPLARRVCDSYVRNVDP